MKIRDIKVGEYYEVAYWGSRYAGSYKAIALEIGVELHGYDFPGILIKSEKYGRPESVPARLIRQTWADHEVEVEKKKRIKEERAARLDRVNELGEKITRRLSDLGIKVEHRKYGRVTLIFDEGAARQFLILLNERD